MTGMRRLRSLSVLLAFSLGCAHSPLSRSALEETKRVALVARIEDEAGPKSTVFRDDGSYRDRLGRLENKEADRRLAHALAAGSYEKERLTHRSISRFELADSLRSHTLALLPKRAPWTGIVHPVEVARVLESFLVQEVPANEPDYARLGGLGVDTILEIVVDEYGMRSEGGKAGAYMIGYARMFRIGGPQLYHRRFQADDLRGGLDHLDPFLVRRNAELFAARVKQMVAAVAAQLAQDLMPADGTPSAPSTETQAHPVEPKQQQVPLADDPL